MAPESLILVFTSFLEQEKGQVDRLVHDSFHLFYSDSLLAVMFLSPIYLERKEWG